jgi:hypothetical protein
MTRSGANHVDAHGPSVAVNMLVVQHERHHHVHLILGDLSLVATDVLFFDPGAAYVAK